MKWIPSPIALGGKKFDAFKSAVMAGNECQRLLREVEKSNEWSSALFIRWLPITFRPANVNNPAEGLVSDDDPDQHELWRITNCPLKSAVEIALFNFCAPNARYFRKGDHSRLDVVRFISQLRDFTSLELDFVCETCITFRFSLAGNDGSKAVFEKIAHFRRQCFNVDENTDSKKWQWKLFSEKHRFSLGVAD